MVTRVESISLAWYMNVCVWINILGCVWYGEKDFASANLGLCYKLKTQLTLTMSMHAHARMKAKKTNRQLIIDVICPSQFDWANALSLSLCALNSQSNYLHKLDNPFDRTRNGRKYAPMSTQFRRFDPVAGSRSSLLFPAILFVD